MFVQVIEARTSDPVALKAQLDRWLVEIGPGATGYEGTTAGVTADGQFIAMARFASQAAAQANSTRPEQGAWWAATEALLEGEVTFRNCTRVDIGMVGSDDAGFVQIIQGTVSDPDRWIELAESALSDLRRLRPELLGWYAAWEGNLVTEAAYFTDAAAAHEGEQRPLPADVQARFAEYSALLESPRYLDLTDPWLVSA